MDGKTKKHQRAKRHKKKSNIVKQPALITEVPDVELYHGTNEEPGSDRKTLEELIRELEASLDLSEETEDTEIHLDEDPQEKSQLDFDLTAEPQKKLPENVPDYEFLRDPEEADPETGISTDTSQEGLVTGNQEGSTEKQKTELASNPQMVCQQVELIPSLGIVDYSSKYRAVLNDERELIQSASYFVSLRKQYMAEIMTAWDDISKDLPVEVAAVLLNEFLSPKFTLLEFEYKNLSKAGRAEREKEEQNPTLSEIWQKYILGKVLTENEENTSSLAITTDEKDNGETDVKKETKKTKDGETSDKQDETDLTVIDKEVARCAVEIFSKIIRMYKRIKWFIRYINVDKLNICPQLKRTIRTAIITFNRSFSVTWRVVSCLNYLDILESVRKNATEAIRNVLIKMNRMLVEEKMGVFTPDTGKLLQVAHLFIDKYRENMNEDVLFRRGFGYLSRKLTQLKKDNTNGHLIMNVASHLANEESNITEVYEILKPVFNFEIVNI